MNEEGASKPAATLLAAIGRAPMVPLRRLTPPASAQVLVKLEFMNPSGSIKDRMAARVIADAVAAGALAPGGTIIESSSGNTGVSLAMLGAALGYKVVIAMPADGPEEARRRVSAYGAELAMSAPTRGMAGAAALARRLAAERPGALLVDQFANPSGVRAHEEGTGLEIAEALGGRAMDAWLAGVGTGATLMGVALALRRRFPAMQVMAVEPARSPVLSKGEAGAHRIPGIGPAFVPAILRQELINRVVPVEDDEALAAAAALARDEGLFCGPSSGANVAAALRVAAQLGPGKTIVTVLPDNGERYLKAGLWAVGG